MNIVYLGSPDAAIGPLKHLLDNENNHNYKVVGVVSQPAKKVGRGKKAQLLDPPLALWAKEKDLVVLQPEKARDEDFLKAFEMLKPDVAVTCAYGQILTDKFLSIPKRATINIHPSKLPEYRGAIPVAQALLDGLKKTSVSILFTVKKLDAGAIISQKEFDIENHEKCLDLTKRLFDLSGPMLLDALEQLKNDAFAGIEQDESKVTHCKKIAKEDGLVQWSELTSDQIINRFRAYDAWPGIHTHTADQKRALLGEVLKVENIETTLSPGEFSLDKKTNLLLVGCAEKTVVSVAKVKPEGSKFLDASSFFNGQKSKSQTKFL